MRVRAFAKINRSLRVLGVRPDGFHELRTVFQSIALHDTLTIRAVRADKRLWTTVASFLRPGGRVLWFTTPAGLAAPDVGPRLAVESVVMLLSTTGSQLAMLRKA